MITTSNLAQKIFYSMLFMPILAYVGIVFLGLKDTVYVFRIIIILYGLLFVFFSPRKIIIPTFAWFLLVFVLYQYVWSFFNDGPQGRFLNISLIYGNKHFALFCASVIIYNTRFSDAFINKTVKVLKITVVLAAIATVIQFFYPRFLNAYAFIDSEVETIISRDIHTDRRASIFGFVDPNSVGLDFLPLLSILIAVLVLYKSKYKTFFLVFGAFVAVGSNVRYVMGGFVLLFIQLFFSYKNLLSGFMKSFFSILIILYLLYIFAILIDIRFDRWVTERLLVEGTLEETARFKAYYTFSTFFPESPFWGTGEFTEELEYASILDGSVYIHMGYLRYLVVYGAFGCFWLFGAWFLIARKFYSTARNSGYWGSFFSILVFLMAFATFFESSLFFYGLLFALIFDKYFADKYNMDILFKKQYLDKI